MKITIPHSFSRDGAIKKVKDTLAEARPQFQDKVEIQKEEWNGDTLNFAFTAQGQSISGALAVEDTQYILEAKLPFMLRMFEGRIQAEIEKQLAQMKLR